MPPNAGSVDVPSAPIVLETKSIKPQNATPKPSARNDDATWSIYNLAPLGPLFALLALPAGLMPEDSGDLASALFAGSMLVVTGVLGSHSGIGWLETAAGDVLDRLVNARSNWVNDTLRSFVETACWLYITLQLHLVYRNALASTALGVVAGFAMTALGSTFTNALRQIETNMAQSHSTLRGWKLRALATPEAAGLITVVVFGVLVRVGIRSNMNTVGVGLLSTFLAGASMISCSEILVRSAPQHFVSRIARDRLVDFATNWQHSPVRSCVEVLLWLSAVFASHWLTQDFISSLLLGAPAGLASAVIGDLVVKAGNPIGEELKPIEHVEDEEFFEEAGITYVGKRFYAPPKNLKNKKDLPESVTMEEAAKHNTRDDLWIVIDGHAYDITSYVDRHPGGWLPLVNMAGKDATNAFAEYHTLRVSKAILPQFHVAPVANYTLSPLVAEHREIRQELLRRGLYQTNISYYLVKFVWVLSLLALAVGCVVLSDSTAARMGGAVLLGFFWQQIAFIGHDVGHNSVTHKIFKENFYGSLLGNPLVGISLAWWKRSHNVHHIVCNSVEHDPDIQHLPAFAVTDKIFGKFWSTYHEKWMVTDWASRQLVMRQHYLFYPIMALARLNLYLQGWILLLNFKEAVRHRWIELMGLAIFMSWNGALLAALPTPAERLAFFFISHAVGGVLHVQICISHFAMDTYHGHPYNNDEDEWFKMQLKTTMNVSCPEYMDWFHGGLQFQIEHHLFPRLPRHNLRAARELVMAMCKRNNIEYHEYGFIEANVVVIRQMKKAAAEAGKLVKGDGGFYHSMLWEGMNAQG